MPTEYYRFKQFWDKVQFKDYDDYLNQSYYILKKLEWWSEAEDEGKTIKEAKDKSNQST